MIVGQGGGDYPDMPLAIRTLAAAVAVTLALPEVAHARREPSLTEPAAPMPVAPAAASAPVAAASVAAAPVSPAPVAAAPVAAAPVADPWSPPLPAPSATPSSVPPPRVVAPPPPSHGDGKDLIAIGLSSFGAFYLFTSLAGAVIIDNARKRRLDEYGERKAANTDRINYGRALLVPVAGPFIGIRYSDSAKERWGAAFTGSVQVAGVVMAAVGAIRHARARRAQRFAVGAGMASGGGVVSLTGRF